MKVLVVTVVHNPTDARIFRREIEAMLAHGIEVTAIAPWKTETPGDPRVHRIAVPRAVGRQRFAALRAARARMREAAHTHDIVLIHDPELLLVTPWADLKRAKTRVVWDVHEDLAAAILTKAYIPAPVRKPLATIVRVLEKVAERRCVLLLAEKGYQARFSKQHHLVLNLPPVPEALPSAERKRQAIYVGSITEHRGLSLMIELAARLAPHGISVKIIGETHSERDAQALREAVNLEWNGALPNALAMAEVEQSMVGLSLLADIPNYRHSMPTKILEYMASGAVVVSTPLPLAVEVLGEDGVLLKSFGTDSLDQATQAIVDLVNNESARQALTRDAFERVSRDYNWHRAGADFVQFLEQSRIR